MLVFGSAVAQAQQIVLSGKVVDAETKESLPFATLSISGQAIGVVANDQGDFDFHIPIDFRNDILRVTMVGYQAYEAPVWSLEGKSIVITLTPGAVMLREVVVYDSLRAGEIMRLALSRIEQNYPMEPFMMDGFYRDVKKLGGTYISLLEAAVKIYDENYQAPRNKFKLRERVALREVRRSLGYTSKFTSFFDRDNLLEDLLLNNNVRYRQFPDEDEFFKSLELEDNTLHDGRDTYVISNAKDFRLRVYVDKETYGIVRVEYENDHQEKLEKMRDLESRFVRVKRVIDFKSFQGKLYLNYLTVTSQINWYDRKSGQLKFETELFRQLLINHIYPHPTERIGLWQKMRGYGLQYQDQAYNKPFWDNYNVIKESPLDRKIIEDLERIEPLEKQFIAN